MQPIKTLTETQIKLIQKVKTKSNNPIDQLTEVQKAMAKSTKLSPTDVIALETLFDTQPESVLLYFASKQYDDYISIQTPITDKLDLITKITTDNILDSRQSTWLKHKDSDIKFDLTLIDLYQDNDNTEDENPPKQYITSYLYGEPYSEDWTERKQTLFCDIEDVIKTEE